MKKLSILLSLCLALALGGCSMLREEAAPAEEDRLVGIYVTPEYIDTFDFEAYFEDNASQLLSGGGGEISAEDAEEYSQRIYATNNGGREGELEFPIWGVPLVCARYGEGEESYVAGTSSPCLEGGSFNMKYADELESCTLSGTIYCPAGENVQAYCNHVYQQADGRLYLTSGQGMSSDGAGTMSFTLSNETAGPEGERGWAVDITLDITPKCPTERVCVLLYGEDGELLGREEFAPEAAPEKIPAGDAAYAVVEDHTRDDSGEKAVERLFIQPGESFLVRTLPEGSAFYELRSVEFS